MAVLARSSAAPLLLALLACAASAAGGASICDTANCGRGDCAEVPGLPPNYECRCDPGWSRALKLFPFSPCIVPDCTFDGACLNLSLTLPIGIPKDVCAVVSCGEGGACKAGAAMFSYSCECRPGYANMLEISTLPCVKNCFFGSDCYALGLGPAAGPVPPPPAPPSGDDGSPAPSTPSPSSTKGSISLLSRQQLLLLAVVSVAMLQAV